MSGQAQVYGNYANLTVSWDEWASAKSRIEEAYVKEQRRQAYNDGWREGIREEQRRAEAEAEAKEEEALLEKMREALEAARPFLPDNQESVEEASPG